MLIFTIITLFNLLILYSISGLYFILPYICSVLNIFIITKFFEDSYRLHSYTNLYRMENIESVYLNIIYKFSQYIIMVIYLLNIYILINK